MVHIEYFFIIIKLTKNITPYYNGDIYRALQFKTGNVILKTINFHRRILEQWVLK